MRIQLKSGRYFEANRLILGLSLEDGEDTLFEGYDGEVHMPAGEEWTDPTPEERKELATVMVARWAAWGGIDGR